MTSVKPLLDELLYIWACGNTLLSLRLSTIFPLYGLSQPVWQNRPNIHPAALLGRWPSQPSAAHRIPGVIWQALQMYPRHTVLGFINSCRINQSILLYSGRTFPLPSHIGSVRFSRYSHYTKVFPNIWVSSRGPGKPYWRYKFPTVPPRHDFENSFHIPSRA